MSDSPGRVIIDRAALAELAELVGGDPVFLAEMIDTFLDDCPKVAAEMRTAADAGDAVALRRAAHTLKSNSRTFGASALADLCQQIEVSASTGNLDGLAPLVERAVASYPDVVEALKAERPQT